MHRRNDVDSLDRESYQEGRLNCGHILGARVCNGWLGIVTII